MYTTHELFELVRTEKLYKTSHARVHRFVCKLRHVVQSYHSTAKSFVSNTTNYFERLKNYELHLAKVKQKNYGTSQNSASKNLFSQTEWEFKRRRQDIEVDIFERTEQATGNIQCHSKIHA